MSDEEYFARVITDQDEFNIIKKYYEQHGNTVLKFYRNNELCKCSVCKNLQLKWSALIEYIFYNFSIVEGDLVEEIDTDLMMKVSKMWTCRDKYICEMDELELRNWHLGLFSDDYLNKLPEPLQKHCLKARDEKYKMGLVRMLPYVFAVHRDCVVGK